MSMLLSNLVKLVKKRKIVGRGGCRGTTSGRGSNGQLSRQGGRSEIKPFFEGGQMSLSRRMPRRGFASRKKYEVQIVDIANLNSSLGENINKEVLLSAGLVKSKRNSKIKLLGNFNLSEKFNVEVDFASKAAKLSIENAGGSVVLVGENS